MPASREAFAGEGGHLFAGNLCFGECLDLPPLTMVIEKATRLSGLEPTPFEEGLRRAFAGYLNEPSRAVDYAFEDRVLRRG